MVGRKPCGLRGQPALGRWIAAAIVDSPPGLLHELVTVACAALAAVCAYLTERAERGVSIRTIDLACSAIAYEHRNRGVEEPTADQAVRQVRRGLRRTLGTAPRRRTRPPERGRHP